METFVCPKGHSSTEPDYCSECGARIVPPGAAPNAVQPVPLSASFPSPELPPFAAASHHGAPVEACPACGAQREKSDLVFCEVCGANFSAPPPIPPPAPTPGLPEELPPFTPQTSIPLAAELAPIILPEPVVAAAAAAGQSQAVEWEVTVAVDPALRHPASPDAPADYTPYTVALTEPVSLIGRKSEVRAIFPRIALQHDDAVSHRHALLQVGDTGALELRDIGSANGTRLNGVEIQPMRDYPLHPGDEIALGHWTRLTVGSKARGVA